MNRYPRARAAYLQEAKHQYDTPTKTVDEYFYDVAEPDYVGVLLATIDEEERGKKWWEAVYRGYNDYKNNYAQVSAEYDQLRQQTQAANQPTFNNAARLNTLLRRLSNMLYCGTYGGAGGTSAWTYSGFHPNNFGPNPVLSDFLEIGYQQMRQYLHTANKAVPIMDIADHQERSSARQQMLTQ